jgi:ADP-ribose pyrophosphatase
MLKKVQSLKTLFRSQWVNLFEAEVDYEKKKVNWTFCSRKEVPYEDNSPDAVMIVPIDITEDEPKLLMTKEFRIPVNGYEYAFPAGLLENGATLLENAERELLEETGYGIREVLTISPPRLYSSAGITDEMVQIIVVTAEKRQEPELEDSEDIECLLLSLDEMRALLKTNPVMGAKAWPVCYAFDLAGKFPTGKSK